ncbi:hypothetical protein [Croceicoccus sp. Ery15]|uniref:hypothetical protein n=1 Tax=Croceicoccus sp. Ery15 TaxID=1703338 RepID=UPI001E40A24B|nr:hypothetical protein [Croceicoccus sp. Ery15]
MATRYGPEVGFFQNAWNNPPAPFNPLFDPGATARRAKVTSSMEADGFYKSHTREECKAEWHRRYNAALSDEKATHKSE